MLADPGAPKFRAVRELISLSELDLIVGCSSISGMIVGRRQSDANVANFFVRDFISLRERCGTSTSDRATNFSALAEWRARCDGK